MLTKDPTLAEQLIAKTQVASKAWQAAFNRGDAKACTEHYESNAIMCAKPFGEYKGHADILAFWEHLISEGFTNIEYLEPIITVENETTTRLTSLWRMNKAQGIITHELWVLQADGQMKLREDHFEAQP